MGDRGRREPTLGKRGPFADQERGGRDRGFSDGLLHLRMLVPVKKAGCVIGKGGDFIQMTKSKTGAKVGVDKPIGNSEERLVHVQGLDEPNKAVAGITEAVMSTAERIIGDDSPDGLKLPHKATLRMLLFKYQIGAVMGKKGATINEIRNKSGATVKLTTPHGGAPIVPSAENDDELITVSGTSEQIVLAVRMISEKLRAVLGSGPAGGSGNDRGAGAERGMLDRHGDNKRSRGPEPDDRRRGGPGMGPGGPAGPPPDWYAHPGAAGLGGPPPSLNHPHAGPHAPLGPAGGGLPGTLAPPPGAASGTRGAIAMSLPYAARGVLANNDSVKTEGLVGMVTVEYRVLVPVRRSGVILGGRGGMIQDIRNRTGARVNMFDEEKGCEERVLQVLSTEDVQDQRCAAFDAAMDCIHVLVNDDPDPVGTVRIILPHGQVGAIMGKAGSTIKELRSVSGCSVHLSSFPDTPRCVRKGEEVMEIRGARDAALLASHIALVAIRGNMARGQLIYAYPPPQGAPPPTPRPPPLSAGGPPPAAAPPLGGPPPGGPAGPYVGVGGPPPGPGVHGQHGGPPAHAAGRYGAPPPQQPPQYGGPQGPDPRLPPHQQAQLPSGRGSRWDSDARGNTPGQQPPPQGPGMAPLPGPPAAAVGVAQAPMPGQVVYTNGNAAPAPQQQVQYLQSQPPAQQQQQQHHVQGLPPPSQQQQQQQQAPPQVQYVQGPPPQGVQVVYTQQAPAAGGYAAAPQQQQQQVLHSQQAPAAGGYAAAPQPQQQPLVEYATSYVQQPAQQPQQQQQPVQVVYTSSALPSTQPQYVDQHQQQLYAQQQQPVPQVSSMPPQQQTHQQPPPQQQVTYIYAQAPAAASAAPNSSGPGSTSGYGGLATLVGAAAAAAPPALSAPVAAPAPAAAQPPPKARVLLTQEQVTRLRLDDKNQCLQLSALSGASITVSDNVLEGGTREVLLAGSDAQCNTAKNLMEALMRSG